MSLPESPEYKSQSRTSINVKIPSADAANKQRRSSAHRSQTPATPYNEYDATVHVEGHEFRQFRPYATPTGSQHSDGKLSRTVSPQRAVRPMISRKTERDLIRHAAVSIVEKAWVGYRDKQMFRLLKHAVCAAENSLTHEILRKVSPKEAELLRDKSLQVKVRFRFGGLEFPPMIYFKIFIHSTGKGVQYISGKRTIKPATGAAEDSLKLMGNRKFLDQILQDEIYQQQFKITDETDVTTLKDYMQYLSNMDETPAYMGGKGNYWRKLTLDVLPRHTLFYDVVDFLYNNRLTPQLKEEIPLLVSRPVTQEIKLKHINAVARVRTPVIPNAPAPTPAKSKLSGTSQMSGRRSKQARLRALKMRRMYGGEESGENSLHKEQTTFSEDVGEDYFDKYGITGDNEEEEMEAMDQEVNKLYEWTQELSFNDELIGTPRLIST